MCLTELSRSNCGLPYKITILIFFFFVDLTLQLIIIIFTDTYVIPSKRIMKFLTGAELIPPSGILKTFTIEFKDCVKGCCCYPRVSTCILVITLPLHINSDIEMKQVMETALEGDVGFGQV